MLERENEREGETTKTERERGDAVGGREGERGERQGGREGGKDTVPSVPQTPLEQGAILR